MYSFHDPIINLNNLNHKIKTCKKIVLTIICPINSGKSKCLRNKLKICVIVKVTRTCISNIGSEDLQGTLPFFCPPQNPSETIFGGAAEQTLKVKVVESNDLFKNANSKNKV
jgi:hypothetical protein